MASQASDPALGAPFLAGRMAPEMSEQAAFGNCNKAPPQAALHSFDRSHPVDTLPVKADFLTSDWFGAHW